MTNNDSILKIENITRFDANLSTCYYYEGVREILIDEVSNINSSIGLCANLKLIENFIIAGVIEPFNDFLTNYDVADGYHNGVELVLENVSNGVDYIVFHTGQSLPLFRIHCLFVDNKIGSQMNKTRYFISKVDGSGASNLAQDYVYDKFHALEFRLIEDNTDLNEFEKYLGRIVDDANNKFTRSKKLNLVRAGYILGGYDFCVRTSRGSAVVACRVIEIKGEWEGGIK